MDDTLIASVTKETSENQARLIFGSVSLPVFFILMSFFFNV